MSALLLVLLAVFLIGAALGVYALAAPRRGHTTAAATPVGDLAVEPPRADESWSEQAGREFSGLSETARCELVFAVAALDDAPARQLLLAALDDPCEAVTLAAAHALAKSGRICDVQTYASAHPGPRADRVLETVALLQP